ncbi:MAG: hypothetical protein GXP27_16290 [Planctomycetes bacterium]|nr:hypothetical protein [Planctomycetota bacterium]
MKALWFRAGFAVLLLGGALTVLTGCENGVRSETQATPPPPSSQSSQAAPAGQAAVVRDDSPSTPTSSEPRVTEQELAGGTIAGEASANAPTSASGARTPTASSSKRSTLAGDQMAQLPHPGNGASASTTSGRNVRPREPLLKGWKRPAVAIVLTGEQHGYFEPCGCTEHQLGGMARRADLFRILREERKWPVFGLDLGGMIKRNRQQSQLKFQTLLAAHRELGYQAMALGPEELRFDPYYLLSQHQVDPDHPERSLAFLSANVVLLGTPDLGTPLRSKLVQIGGIKVAVTAVFGLSLKAKVRADERSDEITVEDPLKVLPDVLSALEKNKPDLLVLLSHASLEESRTFAQRFPQIDLILSAGGVEDPLSDNPRFVGDTMIVTVGRKAKYAGVVGFYPGQKDHKLRFELVALDDQRFQDSPRMRQYMRLYQEQLRDLKLAETEAQKLAVQPPGGAKFVGAERCGECHTQAFEVWESTPHSHAFESLIHGREGETDPIPRIYDPECLACHVVGWKPQDVVPYRGGYVSQEKTPHLKNVQCENCHGPGSRHIQLAEEENLKAARREMRVTLETARQKLCYGCHDLDNSPGFDFDEYWPEIEHKGLD